MSLIFGQTQRNVNLNVILDCVNMYILYYTIIPLNPLKNTPSAHASSAPLCIG